MAGYWTSSSNSVCSKLNSVSFSLNLLLCLSSPFPYWQALNPASHFPHGSAGKEPGCNAGDPGSIPGLGRSPGEGNGSPLQYSWLENPMDRGALQPTVHGVTKSRTRVSINNWPHLKPGRHTLQFSLSSYTDNKFWWFWFLNITYLPYILLVFLIASGPSLSHPPHIWQRNPSKRTCLMCLSSLEILYLLPIASMVTLRRPNTKMCSWLPLWLCFPLFYPDQPQLFHWSFLWWKNSVDLGGGVGMWKLLFYTLETVWGVKTYRVKVLVPQLCPTLWDTWTVAHPWNSPGKNTGVGCHFLLQGIFLTQG